MNFGDTALQLCGQCAFLLGWRPHEFWDVTPAELACVLNSLAVQSEGPPRPEDLQKLMEAFPDDPAGGE